MSGGQTVRVEGLQARKDLNGELGVALKYVSDTGRWLVRLRNGEGVKIKPDNLAGMDGAHGRVYVFWGDARWSRAQLLGEIARGTGACVARVWPMCPWRWRRGGKRWIHGWCLRL